MDWVADGVAVGTHAEATDGALIAWAELQSALILADDLFERDLLALPGEVLQLRVRDGHQLRPEWLAAGIEFVNARRGAGDKVLIACGQGRSRSVSFAIAHVTSQGTPLVDAVRQVTSRRPYAVPHPVLLQSLAEYFKVPLDIPGTVREIALRGRTRRLAGPGVDMPPDQSDA